MSDRISLLLAEVAGLRESEMRAQSECDKKRNGTHYRKLHPELKRRGHSWLTISERERIRQLLACGTSHSKIAALIGVSVGTISRVRNSHA